jgi:hypothetical protein
VIEDGRDPLQKLGVGTRSGTLRVLVAVGDLTPAQAARGSGPSNREVAEAAGVEDEVRASELLERLEGLGLIENTGVGAGDGMPTAWGLTTKGVVVRLELEAEDLA